MTERGDVFRLKRQLGFSAKGQADAVVVVQASPLNTVLSTIIVVPLDPAVGAYAGHPAALRLSRQEAGSTVDHVAVTWRLRAIPADALAPGPVGRLRPATLAALDERLELILGLGSR
jgi:mRNA-degrading endonuclease toxin of MazEF toxin-antitoxin module